MRTVAIFLFYTGLSGLDSQAFAQPHRFSFYLGPGTDKAMSEMARLKSFGFVASSIATLGWNARIYHIPEQVELGTEALVTKHSERFDLWSFAGAFVVRWERTPWRNVFRSSLAFSNGLSWATGDNDIEINNSVERSQLLYFLAIEFAFPFFYRTETTQGWDFFFRLHHRSGIFGIINGVVGGSNYFTLGIRI